MAKVHYLTTAIGVYHSLAFVMQYLGNTEEEVDALFQAAYSIES